MPRRRARRRVPLEGVVVEVGQLRRRRERRVGMQEVWRIVRRMGGSRKRLGLVLGRRESKRWRWDWGFDCEVEEGKWESIVGAFPSWVY